MAPLHILVARRPPDERRGTRMKDKRFSDVADGLQHGVSIVVPVYNGAAALRELTRRIFEAMRPLGAWELIFVVDGSPDHSWDVVGELIAEHREVVGIELFRNFGQQNTLLAGIRSATFDIVVTMDDDLQHRPETIPTLLDAMTDSVDLVYGQPLDKEHSAWRNITSSLAKAAMGASVGGAIARNADAFDAFRTSLRQGFARVDDPSVSIDVLLSWVTTDFTTAVTPMDPRQLGSSNYNVRLLMRHAVNMVTGYSTKPLRFVTWLGFALALFGAGTLSYVVIRYFLSDTGVPGFPFSGFAHLDPGRRSTLRPGCHRRVPRTHAFSAMQRPTYVVRQVRRNQSHPHNESDP